MKKYTFKNKFEEEVKEETKLEEGATTEIHKALLKFITKYGNNPEAIASMIGETLLDIVGSYSQDQTKLDPMRYEDSFWSVLKASF